MALRSHSLGQNSDSSKSSSLLSKPSEDVDESVITSALQSIRKLYVEQLSVYATPVMISSGSFVYLYVMIFPSGKRKYTLKDFQLKGSILKHGLHNKIIRVHEFRLIYALGARAVHQIINLASPVPVLLFFNRCDPNHSKIVFTGNVLGAFYLKASNHYLLCENSLLNRIDGIEEAQNMILRRLGELENKVDFLLQSQMTVQKESRISIISDAPATKNEFSKEETKEKIDYIRKYY